MFFVWELSCISLEEEELWLKCFLCRMGWMLSVFCLMRCVVVFVSMVCCFGSFVIGCWLCCVGWSVWKDLCWLV